MSGMIILCSGDFVEGKVIAEFNWWIQVLTVIISTDGGKQGHHSLPPRTTFTLDMSNIRLDKTMVRGVGGVD